jgi:formylglycine-generating enzyme required for sulfatase activity
MGSPVSEKDHKDDELEHKVELLPFFIGKYEITQDQWERVMHSNPSQLKKRPLLSMEADVAHPLEYVSWFEALEYVTRMGLTLPTEAQWEYAACAGTKTPWSFGPDEWDLKGKENIFDKACEAEMPGVGAKTMAPWNDGFANHAPVDQFPANPFGLHNAHGNVSEWCQDIFRSTAPSESLIAGTGGEPIGAKNDARRAFRGGSWYMSAIECRTATRFAIAPSTRMDGLGFRVARPLDR